MKLTKKQLNSQITDANLSLEEIESLAEEIRNIMLKGKCGVTMGEYIKAAQRIRPRDLGYRMTRAFRYEPKMESYFPSEVYEILKQKAIIQRFFSFQPYDIKFMRDNAGKGIAWVAQHMYSYYDTTDRKIRKLHISYQPKQHHYTDKEREFVKNNIDKGLKWLSTKINVDRENLRKLAKRMGIFHSHW